MEDKDSPWTLESPMTISRMESQSSLTATSMAIWLRNVGRRKRKKQENVSNATKKDTLQGTIKGSSQ